MFLSSCKVLQRTLVVVILLIVYSDQKLLEKILKPVKRQDANGVSLDSILNATRNAVLKHIPETYLSFQNISYVLKLKNVDDVKSDVDKAVDSPENGNIPLREIIADDEKSHKKEQNLDSKFQSQTLKVSNQINQTNQSEELLPPADEPSVVIKGAKLISYHKHHSYDEGSKTITSHGSNVKNSDSLMDETIFNKDIFEPLHKISESQESKQRFLPLKTQGKSSLSKTYNSLLMKKTQKYATFKNDLPRPLMQPSKMQKTYLKIKQKQSAFFPSLTQEAFKIPFNSGVHDLNDLSQDIFDEHAIKRIDDSQTNIAVPVFASVDTPDDFTQAESDQPNNSINFYTDYRKKINTQQSYPNNVYPVAANTFENLRDQSLSRTSAIFPTLSSFANNPNPPTTKNPLMTGIQSQPYNIEKDSLVSQWPMRYDSLQYNNVENLYAQPSYGQILYGPQSVPYWNVMNKNRFANYLDPSHTVEIHNEATKLKPEIKNPGEKELTNQQSFSIFNIPSESSPQQLDNPSESFPQQFKIAPESSLQQLNFPAESSPSQIQRKSKQGENLNKIRILCIGDSLTSGYYGNRKIYHPYSVMLGYLLKSNIGNEFEIINRGVGGEKVHIQMYKRLEKLLVTEAPLDLVVILGGLNDLIKLDLKVDIFSEIEALHELCHAHGVSTVSLTIPETRMPLSKRVYSSYNEFLVVWGILNEKIRNYKSNWTISCDLARQFPLASLSDPEKRAWWSDDYIHPTIAGYDQIGRIIYDCIVAIL